MTPTPLSALPIGVFDSGVGGLTVAKAIRAALPHESLLYLGDTARVPYGNRGAETIRRYALGATATLVARGIKALVIACNTASAYGLEAISQAYPDLLLIGVITPAAEQATARSESGHIGVIATRGTIESQAYTHALHACDPKTQIATIACPLFVPLAEEDWTTGDVATAIATRYLTPLAQTSIDTLILGCTHYPLLQPVIAQVLDQFMPRYVSLIDSAHTTASQLQTLLATHDLLTPPTQTPPLMEFLVTDEPKGFMRTAVRFFGGPIPRPHHIDL